MKAQSLNQTRTDRREAVLVMVVQAEEDEAEMVAEVLRQASYEVVSATAVRSALHFARRRRPDIALLDVVVTGGTGLEVCRELRLMRPDIPIIFVSYSNRTADILDAFAAGADDYITKPFRPAELVARVRAVARRVGYGQNWAMTGPLRLVSDGLVVDVGAHRAYFSGNRLGCTKKEFELLAELAKYPGQVLTYAFLTEHIWGYKNMKESALLKSHISALRRKLRGAGGQDDLIRTVYAVGYSLTPV